VVPADVDQLFMIDISIDELMGHPALVWIDHHKSAIEKHPDSIRGYRIDGVAACRLAWQWFAAAADGTEEVYLPGRQAFIDRVVREPLAVRLAGEYDVWDKRDARADVFQSGLRSQEIDWPGLLREGGAGGRLAFDYVNALLIAGGYVQHASREGMAYLMAQGSFDLRWEGLLFLAINAAVRNSAAFESRVRPEHEGCLSFVWSAAKAGWKVSLRGVPHAAGLDLSVIAVKHGGGGHRQACGVNCAALPFALLMVLVMVSLYRVLDQEYTRERRQAQRQRRMIDAWIAREMAAQEETQAEAARAQDQD
jgi:hypothetical protein